MRVDSLHLTKRLGQLALVLYSLVASTRPAQWATRFSWVPQCCLLWCQCPLGCWYRSHVSNVKHQLYPVSQLLDCLQTPAAYDGNCVSTAILQLSLPKNCNYLSSFQVPWLSVLSTSLPWLPLVIPFVVLKDASSVPLGILLLMHFFNSKSCC